MKCILPVWLLFLFSIPLLQSETRAWSFPTNHQIARRRRHRSDFSLTRVASNENMETEPSYTETEPWFEMISKVTQCLLASDRKRDSGFDGSSTGWTSWVDDASALRLQECLDGLVFSTDSPTESVTEKNLRWLKWLKASPAPLVVELSEDFRRAVLEARPVRSNLCLANTRGVFRENRLSTYRPPIRSILVTEPSDSSRCHGLWEAAIRWCDEVS